MGLLGDRSLDARARAIIGRTDRDTASDALLERATYIEEDPSPAMLEDAAIWLGIVDDLRADGLGDEDIVRIALHATHDELGIHAPGPAIVGHLLSPSLARVLADELRALPERDWRASQIAMVALSKLDVIEPRDEELVALDADPSVLRGVIGALPRDRREALVLKLAIPSVGPNVNTPINALFIVEQLHLVWDLVESAAVVAARAHALELGRPDERYESVVDKIATPFVIETRPTTAARDARSYWSNKNSEQTRAQQIAPRAEALWSAHDITVDAKELATVEAWSAASPARQREIALAVADAVAKRLGRAVTLVDIAAQGGPPIALLDVDGQPFCLVPGGTFEMGFSEDEEAAVRAQAEAEAGSDNHYELFGSLLDHLDGMRPLQRVTVGPLLAMQGPGDGFDLPAAADALADTALRVPSESEWEYLARGGKARELTYRGPAVPFQADDFGATAAAGPGGANAFRLWGFGLEPELCADVLSESHVGVPLDGSPRRGAGPRVVRGGAGQLFPWQDTGEWHLMLSAMRASQRMWEFQLALRYVLGIRCQ